MCIPSNHLDVRHIPKILRRLGGFFPVSWYMRWAGSSWMHPQARCMLPSRVAGHSQAVLSPPCNPGGSQAGIVMFPLTKNGLQGTDTPVCLDQPPTALRVGSAGLRVKHLSVQSAGVIRITRQPPYLPSFSPSFRPYFLYSYFLTFLLS